MQPNTGVKREWAEETKAKGRGKQRG